MPTASRMKTIRETTHSLALEGEDLTRCLSFLSDSYLTAIPAPSFLCRPDLLVEIPLRILVLMMPT